MRNKANLARFGARLESMQLAFDKAAGGCYNPGFVMDPSRAPLPRCRRETR